MGAWSHESFGNDTACDWAGELKRSVDLSDVESALQAVLDVGDDYLDADPASEAIAAAEVIARLQGNFGKRDAYSRPVDVWVSKNPLKPSSDLAAKAHLVLDRVVVEPSELLELWQDSEAVDVWLAAIAELRGRIDV